MHKTVEVDSSLARSSVGAVRGLGGDQRISVYTISKRAVGNLIGPYADNTFFASGPGWTYHTR